MNERGGRTRWRRYKEVDISLVIMDLGLSVGLTRIEVEDEVQLQLSYPSQSNAVGSILLSPIRPT